MPDHPRGPINRGPNPWDVDGPKWSHPTVDHGGTLTLDGRRVTEGDEVFLRIVDRDEGVAVLVEVRYDQHGWYFAIRGTGCAVGCHPAMWLRWP